MSPATDISADGTRLTVRVPMNIRKRGGRKVVIAPHGTAINTPRPRADSMLVKAIARAYRWQRLLEEGAHASIRDLAGAEKISPTYISRLLRLTLLSPEIVAAIVDGHRFGKTDQELLCQPLPDDWIQQDQNFERSVFHSGPR